jgi:hypothetical protein
MPSLARFLLLQVAIGFGLAALFVAALVLADPGGIGSLLRAPQFGPGPVLLLWLFVGGTFMAVQFGAAVALLEHGRPVTVRSRRVRRHHG